MFNFMKPINLMRHTRYCFTLYFVQNVRVNRAIDHLLSSIYYVRAVFAVDELVSSHNVSTIYYLGKTLCRYRYPLHTWV